MTGLRIAPQLGVLGKRLGKLKTSLAASEFKPELSRFAQRTLTECIRATPVRNEATITSAQIKQYHNRVNYIPSFHELNDPTLIVNDEGQHWLYYASRWYLANEWHLPDEAYSAYMELMNERDRRIQTSQSTFVNDRKQARFLYQRSWYQVAQSLSLPLAVNAAISSSRTRKKPPKEPARSYGQWRGGQKVLSVAIQTPFLNTPTRYWKGNGRQILAQATAKERPRFIKDCEDKAKRAISAARRTA